MCTSDVFVLSTQAFSFDFSPKAATMEPSKPSVIVKYSINYFQSDVPSNVIVNSTYRIYVSAFRRHLPVSACNKSLYICNALALIIVARSDKNNLLCFWLLGFACM